MAQKRNKRSKAEPTPMILYHYTSWYHMLLILELLLILRRMSINQLFG